MKPYKVIEDIAIADIAIECVGKDLEELFINNALAIFHESADINNIKEDKTLTFELSSEKTEDLLYDFLSEIIFLKDTHCIIFKSIELSINNNTLKAKLKGEEINREKHELRNDIKAITLHMFKIEKTNEGYKSLVVVDV